MNIVFATMARESVKRSDRGVVGLILKDTVPDTNPIMVYKEKDIPSTLSKDNQTQISLALQGYDENGDCIRPSKVVAYVIASAAESYDDALGYFETKKVNWLACPTIKTDEQEQAVISWVKAQRKERNKVKAVIPSTEADDEGIINYETESVSVGETTYAAEKFAARIAGLLAATPSKCGSTYAALPDVTDCTKLNKTELDAAIDAGKFVIFNDGEKVKVARGVNSLTTTSETKGDSWKKIKVVETMDMVHDDLIMLAEDYYIGKYPNTYSNKCLLLSAIKAYLDEVAAAGLIENYVLDFDVDAIRDYIIENKGVTRDEAEAMSEAEVKKQYTDEKVFMTASMTIVDVMEDIDLNIFV